MSSPALRLIGVSHRFGTGDAAVQALTDVDLDVEPGELVAVMGASGSGKSTLLALAGGLATPTAGEVEVQGRALSAASADEIARLRRRCLGFVFQDFNLIPTLTALENVTLPLELDGVRMSAARREGLVALGAVGMEDLAGAYPGDLSGGQQQRVAIARAVVGGRQVILADEPTGALDSLTGELVMKILRARVDAGAACVLVTHEARHAAWADRIVFVRDGRVVDDSRPAGVETLLTGGEK
jgi:putative ABC transport system ATP-binding protein